MDRLRAALRSAALALGGAAVVDRSPWFCPAHFAYGLDASMLGTNSVQKHGLVVRSAGVSLADERESDTDGRWLGVDGLILLL